MNSGTVDVLFENMCE